MDIEQLRREAEAGDVASMTVLGTLLLVEGEAPFEPEEGTKLIASAAERGDAQAMSIMATLKGAGAWTSHSWPEALALLQRAAEGGAADARAQLVMLADDQTLADHARRGENVPDLWRRLRESIDLEKWMDSRPAVQRPEGIRVCP